MNELRYLTAGGIVHSNGFPEESLDRGMEADPDFIGVDAGSIDGGPYFLGSGENMHSSRAAIKEIYRLLLTRAVEHDIPLLVGTAASAGTNAQVDWTAGIFSELAAEERLSFGLARIYSEVDGQLLKQYRGSDAIRPLDGMGPLTDEGIDDLTNAVAMMGPEPYIDALDQGADVIIAGRSSDVSVLNAIPIQEGFDEGLATHLAKTLECGALLAQSMDEVDRKSGFTGSGDCMLGTLTDDSFRVTPTNPRKKVDALDVASHLLYENRNPFRLLEPRGILNTEHCTYEDIDERSVEVRNSEFHPADQYTVRLEGVSEIGYRAASIAGIRDPNGIEHVDALVENAERAIRRRLGQRNLEESTCDWSFKVYGRNAVMGDREPSPEPGHEVGVFVDVVAPDEDVTHDLLEEAIYALLASSYPKRQSTAGNVAFPISPNHLRCGTAYDFSLWHQLELDDPLEPFTISIEEA